MKKLSIYMLALMSVFAMDSNAQETITCNGTAPILMTGIHGDAIGSTVPYTVTPTYTQSASSEYPNIELLVTFKNQEAVGDTADGGNPGDVIIGTDVDGIFTPNAMNRYGYALSPGDSFEVTAIGYDLTQVQNLANGILTGSTITGDDCCDIFGLIGAPGFCDSLNSVGIYAGSDVQDLTDVLAIFDALSETELSVEGLMDYMELINVQGALVLSQGTCSGGASLPICYGIDPSSRYTYVADVNLAVGRLGEAVHFEMMPNPSTSGQVSIQIEANHEEALMLNVYNTLGERVYNFNLGIVNGNIQHTLQTSNMAQGIYMVELTNGNNKEILKLIVQ